MLIRTTVNGVERAVEAGPETTLLSLLREQLGLLGAKDACGQGECGACSVWLDDRPVCSCLVPAVQAEGRHVRTVESFANDALHDLQEAFLDAGAVQCGFCTPGMLVAAADLLARDPHASELAIREALSGNLCRCTGYQKIVDAVRHAAKETA